MVHHQAENRLKVFSLHKMARHFQLWFTIKQRIEWKSDDYVPKKTNRYQKWAWPRLIWRFNACISIAKTWPVQNWWLWPCFNVFTSGFVRLCCWNLTVLVHIITCIGTKNSMTNYMTGSQRWKNLNGNASSLVFFKMLLMELIRVRILLLNSL